MIIDGIDSITSAVRTQMGTTPDPRLREIMDKLVCYLHAFARDVKLTEPEWLAAVGILARIGHETNDRHNEAMLFSDILGLSSLVALMNNGGAGPLETTASLLGPFWRLGMPKVDNGGSIVRSPTPGAPCFVSGTVVDAHGRPIGGAEVDVWHASPVGLYDNQDDTQAHMNLRGKLTTDAEGRFAFRTVRPAGYPVPMHGPAGRLLEAQRRHPYRPAHLHFLVLKPGYKVMISMIYPDDDPDLERDVVFGVTKPLICPFRRHVSGTPPAEDVTGEWYTAETRLVLQPGPTILPEPPIK